LAGLAVVGAIAAAIALAAGGDGGDATTPQRSQAAGGDEPTEADRTNAGEYPIGAVLDEDRLLVASRDDGTLLAFDPEVISATPQRFALPNRAETDFIARGDGVLWTADARNDLLYQLDPETLEPQDSFPTGDYPRDILVTEELVWVANRESDDLTRLDLATGATTQVPIGPTAGPDYPRRLVGDDDRMWAAFRDSGRVQAFDIATGAEASAPVFLGGEPHGMATEGGFLWVANTEGNSLQRIDLNAPDRAPIESPVCLQPRDVRVVFDAVWVSCGGDESGGELVKLNEQGEERGSVAFDVTIENIAASEELDKLWLTGGASGKLIEVNPGS
jgi:streptogramin lyase